MPKYIKNEDIFEEIDNKDKAYIHGFLCADGYINKNQIILQVKKSDEEVIIKLKNIFEINDNSIIKYKTKTLDKWHTKDKIYEYSLIRISSEKAVNDFWSHLNTKNKTYELRLPQFKSKELILAWIKGYYDGDGCEEIPRIYSANKKLLYDIKEYLQIPQDVIQQKSNVYVLYIGQKNLYELSCNYHDGLKRKTIDYIHENNCKPHQKLDFLSVEILTSLLKTHSLQEIGKMFNVCRGSVFSRCKSLKIYIPKRINNMYTKSKIKNDCEYYPCHDGKFQTCEWCYCPLYPYRQCGGKYKILENGWKDCSKCIIPHLDNDYIIKKLKEIQDDIKECE